MIVRPTGLRIQYVNIDATRHLRAPARVRLCISGPAHGTGGGHGVRSVARYISGGGGRRHVGRGRGYICRILVALTNILPV